MKNVKKNIPLFHGLWVSTYDQGTVQFWKVNLSTSVKRKKKVSPKYDPLHNAADQNQNKLLKQQMHKFKSQQTWNII